MNKISLKDGGETFTGEFIQVKVYDNNVERAIRDFRAKVQKAGVLSDFKKTREYEKPSEKKRRKISESKRKVLKAELEKKTKDSE